MECSERCALTFLVQTTNLDDLLSLKTICDNKTKKKYSTYEKEFYAVIQALKKWRNYLIPKEFLLYSDNQALQFITRHEKLN
jgi:hypothetical protein